MMEIDIWGNMTHYAHKDAWYKQIFFEDTLLKYEDSKGNYWTPECGKYALPKIKLKYDIQKEYRFDTYLYCHKEQLINNTLVFTITNNWFRIFKGETYLDAGYIYAPYIPVMTTPLVNPQTGEMDLRPTERRIYNIDVGNIDEENVEQYINEIANRFRRAPLGNPDMDLRYNQLGLDQDFFIPTRAEPVSDSITAMGMAILANSSFTPKKDLMTRYAKKVVNPNFYGTINVSGLIT